MLHYIILVPGQQSTERVAKWTRSQAPGGPVTGLGAACTRLVFRFDRKPWEAYTNPVLSLHVFLTEEGDA